MISILDPNKQKGIWVHWRTRGFVFEPIRICPFKTKIKEFKCHKLIDSNRSTPGSFALFHPEIQQHTSSVKWKGITLNNVYTIKKIKEKTALGRKRSRNSCLYLHLSFYPSNTEREDSVSLFCSRFQSFSGLKSNSAEGNSVMCCMSPFHHHLHHAMKHIFKEGGGGGGFWKCQQNQVFLNLGL